jgi:hypothetical protein
LQGKRCSAGIPKKKLEVDKAHPVCNIPTLDTAGTQRKPVQGELAVLG